jgi:hypothetical protein
MAYYVRMLVEFIFLLVQTMPFLKLKQLEFDLRQKQQQ